MKYLEVSNLHLFNKEELALLPEDILKKVNRNHLLKRYIMLLISMFISACVFNLLIVPTNIVTGGINGISIILRNIYDFSPSIVMLVISLILLLFSYMYLGKAHAAGTIVAAFLYPLFVQLTSNISLHLDFKPDDLLLISIFIGVVGGFSNGLMYKTGFSNCGLPIISQILYKEFKIPISKSNFVINGIIVLIGGFFFGFTMVMYALIILYINSFMLDRVILGVSKNKAFYIITEEYEEIRKYIIDNLHHNVTMFNVKGGFLEKKRMVLLTVVPSKEYFVVTEGIKEIDSKAFFLACDAYQVEGGR